VYLTRERLDRMAATIYATGEARPDPKAEPIVLRSCCHPDAPAVLWLDPDGLVMTTACSECLLTIAPVSLARPLRSPPTCRACRVEAVSASYRHGSGRLKIECAGCCREIAELPVLSHAN
jgi:hypothetical protein